mgnify:CR=1 FL=1
MTTSWLFDRYMAGLIRSFSLKSEQTSDVNCYCLVFIILIIEITEWFTDNFSLAYAQSIMAFIIYPFKSSQSFFLSQSLLPVFYFFICISLCKRKRLLNNQGVREILDVVHWNEANINLRIRLIKRFENSNSQTL